MLIFPSQNGPLISLTGIYILSSIIHGILIFALVLKLCSLFEMYQSLHEVHPGFDKEIKIK